MAWEGFTRFPAQGSTEFKFKLSDSASEPTIWLENCSTADEWRFDVECLADCGPKGVSLPLNTVLSYLANALKKSFDDEELSTVDLQHIAGTTSKAELSATFKLQLGEAVWEPKYRFVMQNAHRDQVDRLSAIVRIMQEQPPPTLPRGFVRLTLSSIVSRNLAWFSAEPSGPNFCVVEGSKVTFTKPGRYMLQGIIRSQPFHCNTALTVSDARVQQHYSYWGSVWAPMVISTFIDVQANDELLVRHSCDNAHIGHLTIAHF